MTSPLILCLSLFLLLLPAHAGKWNLLLSNVGISAMHMQLLHTDRVVMFDRTDFGPSNISLPNGSCRRDPDEKALPIDCTAHSVEYDVAANSIRPLTVLTDVWCSSGAVSPDGSLVQAGATTTAITPSAPTSPAPPATGRSSETGSPSEGGTPPAKSSPTAARSSSAAGDSSTTSSTRRNPIPPTISPFSSRRTTLASRTTSTRSCS